MKTPERKELKRLSRGELLDIIYAMKKNEEALQSMLAAAQEELKQREIRMENAGSIAEASLALSEVFTAAQKAADTYVSSMKVHAEAEGERILEAARLQAEEIVKAAQQSEATESR